MVMAYPQRQRAAEADLQRHFGVSPLRFNAATLQYPIIVLSVYLWSRVEPCFRRDGRSLS